MNIVNIFENALFIIFPALTGLYSFWADTAKDGFDQEKAIDMTILGTVVGSLISLITHLVSKGLVVPQVIEFNPYAFIFGFFITICYVSTKWKWSMFRILDNIATSFVTTLIIFLFTLNIKYGIKPLYVLIPLLLIVINYFLHKLQESIIKSGFVFCLVTITFCMTVIIKSPPVIDLLFVLLLITLSLSVFILRITSLYGRSKVSNNTPIHS